MKKLKQIALAVTIAGATLTANIAKATPFVVDALSNSTTGGTGAATINLALGQAFTVTVNPDDLWSAGTLPRWGNADGLTFNRFATGTDDSHEIVGTLIGIDHGLYTQGGLTAPGGSLVGQIGGGDFFFVGTNFIGNAAVAGTLNLFYFDNFNSDNTEFITANVSASPNPKPTPCCSPGWACSVS